MSNAALNVEVVTNKAFDEVAKKLGLDIRGEQATDAKDLVGHLAEQGIVELIVVKWFREFELISARNEEWSKWMKEITDNGCHVKPEVLIKYDEHRKLLSDQLVSLGSVIIEHVRGMGGAKKVTSRANSFVPTLNPLSVSMASGNPVILPGKTPTVHEISSALHRVSGHNP